MIDSEDRLGVATCWQHADNIESAQDAAPGKRKSFPGHGPDALWWSALRESGKPKPWTMVTFRSAGIGRDPVEPSQPRACVNRAIRISA